MASGASVEKIPVTASTAEAIIPLPLAPERLEDEALALFAEDPLFVPEDFDAEPEPDAVFADLLRDADDLEPPPDLVFEPPPEELDERDDLLPDDPDFEPEDLLPDADFEELEDRPADVLDLEEPDDLPPEVFFAADDLLDDEPPDDFAEEDLADEPDFAPEDLVPPPDFDDPDLDELDDFEVPDFELEDFFVVAIIISSMY